jgi:RNA polymerase sigma factor (sigma-70 family)
MKNAATVDDDPQQNIALVARCLEHDVSALQELHQNYYRMLISIVVNRGATATQAEDLVADLWGELVMPHRERPALLTRYRGQSPLAAWLVTVATNRFIDCTRTKAFGSTVHSATDGSDQDLIGSLPDSIPREISHDLLHLLHNSVKDACQACEPEAMVMLKLVYIYDVSQRQLARAWGWHESKISRHLDSALNGIRDRALSKLRSLDSHLDVTWDDFLSLCQNIPA